jgi:hypothetical protein
MDCGKPIPFRSFILKATHAEMCRPTHLQESHEDITSNG